jgi:hypothetical protein
MNKGTEYHTGLEGPIYEDLTLYKVIKTSKGQPIAIHMDGSTSVVVPFQSINCNSYDENEYENMFEKIKSIIEDLDDNGITVQFLMNRIRAKRVEEDQYHGIPEFAQPRALFLNKLADNNALFENEYYLAIHCKNKITLSDREGIVKKVINKIKNRNNVSFNLNKAMEGIDERVSRTLETQSSLCQMLDDIGSSFKILKKEQDYYNIMQKFTRPAKSRISNVEINKETERIESPRQALFSGVRAEVRKDEFTLDDYYHKIYTLDRAPTKMIYGKSIHVIDSVPFEIVYSISFRKMSFPETLNTFKFKMATSRMVSGQNEDAIVEDRTITANEERMSNSYDVFAYGDSAGIEVSANLVLRCEESLMERVAKDENLTRKEVIRKLDQIMNKRVFAAFGSSEWVNEPHSSWKVFCNLIPGMSTVYGLVLKKIVLMSQDIPYFISMYDNKIKGIQHNGTNHFVDMKDNLVPFDLMNPNLPAWNYSISGQTGSGKSVLMNAILIMQLAETAKGKGPVICILDVGGDEVGSYDKIMRLAKGTRIVLASPVKPRIQMLELQPERSTPTKKKKYDLAKIFIEDRAKLDLGPDAEDVDEQNMANRIVSYFNEKLSLGSDKLNDKILIKKFEESLEMPFKPEYKELLTLKPGECLPDQNKINMIMALLEVILSSSGKKIDGFSNFDPDEISQIVLSTYEHIGETENRFPRMTDLYNVAETKVDKTANASRKLLNKLKNWTVEGQYPMFDQPTSIDMSNDIILADMKGVENEPKLQMMYTLLISQLFSDKMYFTRNRRKFIVRDEAWSLMKNERARDFFVEDLRTARKNGFATIAISQLPTDYMVPDAQVGKAIMSNMQVNIFCFFEGQQALDDVSREYQLSEETSKELSTLGVKKILQPDGSYKAAYSKFMMLIGKTVYSFKNILDPFEYMLYSSSAEDNAMISYYMDHTEKFSSLMDTLKYIAGRNHIGDLKLAKFLDDAGHFNIARSVRGELT